MQILLAFNAGGFMSPLSQQPLSVPLLVDQKYKSCAMSRYCSSGTGLVSIRTHRHHQQQWCLNTTSFHGSAPAAADHAATSTAKESDAGKMTDDVSTVDGAINSEQDFWGNYFLKYDDPCYEPEVANEAIKKEHEKLKQEVRRMILKIQTTPVTSKWGMPLKEKLGFIDTLQRLGVSCYFENEIGNILQRVHEFDDCTSSNDLHTIAIAFRLLRDQGIYIPPSLFDKFLDQIVQLNEATVTTDDIDGLLALYEASFFAIPDEDNLDRAKDLTANKLKSILQHLDRSKHMIHVEKIEHALCKPIRLNCQRLVARFYISVYRKELTYGELLLKFAIHDYNIRQVGYQKELGALTRWCEELKLKSSFPLARHTLVELHIWGMCIYSDPQYSMARTFYTKYAFLFLLTDDLYDTYGTMEEAEIFTEAFVKMDPNDSAQLQPRMKAIITAFSKFYTEVEHHNPGKPYVVDYLKREYERSVRAYEVTARWIHSGTIPTYEEYMDVTMITGCLTANPCTYLATMGENASEETFRWALDEPLPNYIKASAAVTRLQDDLSPSPSELENSHLLAPQIFMKHFNVSKEEAVKIVKQHLTDAIKTKNKALLRGESDTFGVPRPFLKAIFADVQAGEVCNSGEDKYSTSGPLKEIIPSLFIEPIAL